MVARGIGGEDKRSMTTLKQTEFSHNGRKFEVRAGLSGNEIKVRVFENGERATAVVYSVTIETVFDAKMRGFSLNLADDLMTLAERDVVEGRVPLLKSN